ncbi:delta-60 repeat domain-containing protein [Thermoleophilum album]|uniref:delta-60 repeat domain-containing protein n=1 Tax=Thermoleophilum album TaxID=29539 RepID=UPI000B82C465|nr:delta-60 repeat domain-containing protein [Thermoleophilum album]
MVIWTCRLVVRALCLRIPGSGAEARASALQSDGKLVVVGGIDKDFVVARYNPDGSLDTSFGSGGKVATDLGDRSGRVRATRRTGSLCSRMGGLWWRAPAAVQVLGILWSLGIWSLWVPPRLLGFGRLGLGWFGFRGG